MWLRETPIGWLFFSTVMNFSIRERVVHFSTALANSQLLILTLVDGVVSNSNKSNMTRASHRIYYGYMHRLISGG